MNSVFPLNRYKKTFFSFLAAGFCPKNVPFARKIMAMPESGGAAPWLVRLYSNSTLLSLPLLFYFNYNFLVTKVPLKLDNASDYGLTDYRTRVG